ncbi:class II fructose-bisphosphatase [Paenibacillus profundus]|uniref:Fructose-1,6-bisphosphatase n=1 Tax=Paenibacillus profundus TaxID=1173085 RepID=A0ABS8YHX2_9BACL|nr:class II fructose-bisphosphatase [Paenibacillus profundus]MCE5170140.1 class II fructose-bisphosphatase [Paenibacillus profundus]
MDRQLSLECIRVTEAAALAASRWVGRGNTEEADGAATSIMRHMFESVPIRGQVVIGEGEMDEAPMLYIGEPVGSGAGSHADVAVDPVEGTELVAKGLNGALSVLAVADSGQLLHAPDMYMQKLACGPQLRGCLHLDDPLDVTVKKAAAVLKRDLSEMTVSILDRERHAKQIECLRATGVRLKLLNAGDVAGAMATAFSESGVDLYVGSGGAPEGVLAAAALRCLGGELQARLLPSNEEEVERCLQMGIRQLDRLLMTEDLSGYGDVLFAATGITPGDVLQGVRMTQDHYAETHSLVLRSKTGTVRFVRTLHRLLPCDVAPFHSEQPPGSYAADILKSNAI